MKYDGITITIDGATFDGVTVLGKLNNEMSKAVLGQTETTQASSSSSSGYAQAKVHDAARKMYEASVTFELSAGTFERFIDAVFGKVKTRKRWIDPTPPIEPWRCPLATLMRRAGYGGRKGRSALRRALARPDAEWQAWSSRAL